MIGVRELCLILRGKGDQVSSASEAYADHQATEHAAQILDQPPHPGEKSHGLAVVVRASPSPFLLSLSWLWLAGVSY